jgi:hypothetical protein
LEPFSGGPSGSLVEWLSGKTLELGLALPDKRGSWWAGGFSCLLPGWCVSQWGGAPVIPQGAAAHLGLMGRGSLRGGGLVIPHVAGAQQGLNGGGLGVWASQQAVGSAPSWGLARPGSGYPGGLGSGSMAYGRVSRHGVGLVLGWRLAQLKGGYPCGGWIPCGPRGRDPAVHVSSTGLWPGAA